MSAHFSDLLLLLIIRAEQSVAKFGFFLMNSDLILFSVSCRRPQKEPFIMLLIALTKANEQNVKFICFNPVTSPGFKEIKQESDEATCHQTNTSF